MKIFEAKTVENLPPSPSRESRIIWSGAEGHIVNISIYVVCGLLFWLIIPLLYGAYRCIKTMCHTYQLTDQRLRERSGIFSRRTDELELYRVKDITIHQPLIQRLVGRGCVVLSTSDRSNPTVVLHGIENPLAVADMLRSSVERCRIGKGLVEID